MIDSYHDLRTLIGGTALAFAGASFLVHLVFSGLLAAKEKDAKVANSEVRALMARVNFDPATASLSQLTDLFKAAGGLAESLLKAGPALWSMIGSLLFLVVACLATGALQGGSAPQAKTDKPVQAQPQPQPQPDLRPKHVEPPPPPPQP